jgi:hypothetical protein
LIRALRLFLLLALMLAPPGRAAMAGVAPGAAASGHCENMPAPAQRQPRQDALAIGCALACTATLAALPASPAAPRAAARTAAPNPLPGLRPGGLHPDAELPPPRRS